MTDGRDFDRLARAWLELGPDEAPGRAVAAALLTIESTAQVRPPVRWSSWRSIRMNRFSLAVMAAAALVVVIGGGLILTQGRHAEMGQPSAHPSAPAVTAIPSPTARLALPAAELRYAWRGPARSVSGVADGLFTYVYITSTDFIVGNGAAEFFRSYADIPAAGLIRLRSIETLGGCALDDEGTYQVALTAEGTKMSLAVVSDTCAARAATVQGEWERGGCPNSFCLGSLAATTYVSTLFNPRLPAAAPLSEAFGQLGFTVPAGWSETGDDPSELDLQSTDFVTAHLNDASPPSRGIYTFARPVAAADTFDCSPSAAPGVGSTVDDLVTWIVGHPGLTASQASPITVDGHPGKVLDLAVAPGWTTACTGQPSLPVVQLLTEASPTADSYALWIGKGERIKLILLDLGGGPVVAIAIDDSTGAAHFDTFAAEALTIVQTFRFK